MNAERIAIVGSRGYPYPGLVAAYVGTLPQETVVVSGGARGVDVHAEGTAIAQGLTVVSFRPIKPDAGIASSFGPWTIIKKTFWSGFPVEDLLLEDYRFFSFSQAAYFRNGLIVDASDRIEVWWDGVSPGTRNTIRLAEKAGKPVKIRRP